MKKIEYQGQSGYFITTDQKKQLDNLLSRLSEDCGEDYNETIQSL